MRKQITSEQIQSILDEFKSERPALAAAAPKVKAVDVKKFPALWKSKIRPIMLAAGGIIGMFRPQWSAYFATVIGFIDLQTMPQPVEEE